MKLLDDYKNALLLSTIFALRMLGLFIIFPIFSTYAHQFNGYTPALLGIALGIYGLTQALFQIPLGLCSDRFGRKPIITLGLLLFAFGSIIAAVSQSITGIIIGRALQGSGAIGSTLMAMLADLTSEKNRTFAMAIIGLTIAITFALAMILGPIITSVLSIQGIFWLTSILAFLGILILYTLIPNVAQNTKTVSHQSFVAMFKTVLRNKELLRLDLGIFILHAILTASFVVIPLLLIHQLHLIVKQHWMIYLPILFFSFVTSLIFIRGAEQTKQVKNVFLLGVLTIAISQAALALNQHTLLLTLTLFFFFCGFNLLEASLPSLISKTAPRENKGTAMGIYSSCQFLGIFFGGSIGGWLYGHYSLNSIFYFNALLALVWFVVAIGMEQQVIVSSPLKKGAI